jgi:hypothetical protein
VIIVYGVGRGVNALFPSRDAKHRLGLALLVATAALIALGVGWCCAGWAFRAAGPIAAGTVVVYLWRCSSRSATPRRRPFGLLAVLSRHTPAWR